MENVKDSIEQKIKLSYFVQKKLKTLERSLNVFLKSDRKIYFLQLFYK